MNSTHLALQVVLELTLMASDSRRPSYNEHKQAFSNGSASFQQCYGFLSICGEYFNPFYTLKQRHIKVLLAGAEPVSEPEPDLENRFSRFGSGLSPVQARGPEVQVQVQAESAKNRTKPNPGITTSSKY